MANKERRREYDEERGFNHEVSEYWMQFYCTQHCTLCGNTGIIDSRGQKTPAGLEVGRLNWCICPNGQTIRNQVHREPTESDLKRVQR